MKNCVFIPHFRTLLTTGIMAACGIAPGAKTFAAEARPNPSQTAPGLATDTATETNHPALLRWQQEREATHNSRMEWWRQAKFGMFIHWGIYAVPAGVYHGQQSKHLGEWIMRDYNIPVSEYADYAKDFDPTNFNAEQWVQLAKTAGMKYIVITAKHHDGFAMFHTRVDGYNIQDATPWHHDPLTELAAACRKEGIKLGFYYSEAQDWHHPGGAVKDKHPDKDLDPQHHWDPTQHGSMDDYIKDVAVPQVRELLTGYGPGVPALLWWDTPLDMTPGRVEQFLPLLKSQPQVIINNRLDSAHVIGDYLTPEQNIPTNGLAGDWETCMTINRTWGYKNFDEDWKSPRTLVRNLIDITSKGGNYLLNIGPTSAGIIPKPEADRLREIGAWMDVNGEAIYGTLRSPLSQQPSWGRITEKISPAGTTLYLHVWNWPPDGQLLVSGLHGRIAKTYLLNRNILGWHRHLATVTGPDGITVKVPPRAPDTLSTTVVLKLKSGPFLN